jgi:hypothetical protein
MNKPDSEELRKHIERTNAELDALYERWMSHFREPKSIEDDSIFTKDEEEAWKASEPDFNKRIVKPSDHKRKGDAMLALLFLALATPHIFMQLAASPTEISQLPPPTIKVTLPNFA